MADETITIGPQDTDKMGQIAVADLQRIALQKQVKAEMGSQLSGFGGHTADEVDQRVDQLFKDPTVTEQQKQAFYLDATKNMTRFQGWTPQETRQAIEGLYLGPGPKIKVDLGEGPTKNDVTGALGTAEKLKNDPTLRFVLDRADSLGQELDKNEAFQQYARANKTFDVAYPNFKTEAKDMSAKVDVANKLVPRIDGITKVANSALRTGNLEQYNQLMTDAATLATIHDEAVDAVTKWQKENGPAIGINQKLVDLQSGPEVSKGLKQSSTLADLVSRNQDLLDQYSWANKILSQASEKTWGESVADYTKMNPGSSLATGKLSIQKGQEIQQAEKDMLGNPLTAVPAVLIGEKARHTVADFTLTLMNEVRGVLVAAGNAIPGLGKVLDKELPENFRTVAEKSGLENPNTGVTAGRMIARGAAGIAPYVMAPDMASWRYGAWMAAASLGEDGARAAYGDQVDPVASGFRATVAYLTGWAIPAVANIPGLKMPRSLGYALSTAGEKTNLKNFVGTVTQIKFPNGVLMSVGLGGATKSLAGAIGRTAGKAGIQGSVMYAQSVLDAASRIAEQTGANYDDSIEQAIKTTGSDPKTFFQIIGATLAWNIPGLQQEYKAYLYNKAAALAPRAVSGAGGQGESTSLVKRLPSEAPAQPGTPTEGVRKLLPPSTRAVLAPKRALLLLPPPAPAELPQTATGTARVTKQAQLPAAVTFTVDTKGEVAHSEPFVTVRTAAGKDRWVAYSEAQAVVGAETAKKSANSPQTRQVNLAVNEVFDRFTGLKNLEVAGDKALIVSQVAKKFDIRPEILTDIYLKAGGDTVVEKLQNERAAREKLAAVQVEARPKPYTVELRTAVDAVAKARGYDTDIKDQKERDKRAFKTLAYEIARGSTEASALSISELEKNLQAVPNLSIPVDGHTITAPVVREVIDRIKADPTLAPPNITVPKEGPKVLPAGEEFLHAKGDVIQTAKGTVGTIVGTQRTPEGVKGYEIKAKQFGNKIFVPEKNVKKVVSKAPAVAPARLETPALLQHEKLAGKARPLPDQTVVPEELRKNVIYVGRTGSDKSFVQGFKIYNEGAKEHQANFSLRLNEAITPEGVRRAYKEAVTRFNAPGAPAPVVKVAAKPVVEVPKPTIAPPHGKGFKKDQKVVWVDFNGTSRPAVIVEDAPLGQKDLIINVNGAKMKVKADTVSPPIVEKAPSPTLAVSRVPLTSPATNAPSKQETRSRIPVGDKSIPRIKGQFQVGDKTKIVMPDGTKRPGYYAIVDADSIIQSHNPDTFVPTPDYPKIKGETVNDRDYEKDQAAQLKVGHDAKDLNPWILLSDAPTPDQGPAIVSEDYVVVSGNGRLMSIKRAADNYPDRYDAYVQALLDKAAQFGFNPLSIKHLMDWGTIKRPVLVRVDQGFGGYSKGDLAAYNKPMAKAEPKIDRAKKIGSVLQNNPAMLNELLDAFALGDETTNAILGKPSVVKDLFEIFVKAGVLNTQDLPGYFEQNGELSTTGRELVETAIMGAMFDSRSLNALLSGDIDTYKKSIMRVLPQVAANRKLGEYSLANDFAEALDVARRFVKSKEKTFMQFLGAPNMFGEPPSLQAAIMHQAIAGGERYLKEWLTRYNESAKAQLDLKTGGGLFKETPFTPEQVFDKIVTPSVGEKYGPKELDLIREIIHDVVSQRQGTPAGGQTSAEGPGPAGKTGPAGIVPTPGLEQAPPEKEDPWEDASSILSMPVTYIPTEDLSYVLKEGANEFDEVTYARLKPAFEKAYTKWVGIGGSLDKIADFVEMASQKLGEKARPYAAQFANDKRADSEFTRGQTDFGTTGTTGRFGRPSLRTVNSRNQPRPTDHVKRGEYELDEHQRLAVNLAIQRGTEAIGTGQNLGFLLADGTGTGKAAPLDSTILTPTGWKRMGDIAIGDDIIAGDGSKTIVLDIFPQGKIPIYRITFSDGATAECCDEHLWATKTHKERSWEHPYVVRNLKGIRESLKASYTIPLVGDVQFDHGKLPVDAYVLGVLLGDGCLRPGNVSFASADPQVAKEIEKRLPSGVTLKQWSIARAEKCPVYGLSSTNNSGRGSKNILINTLRSLGLMGKRSFEKNVPREYLHASTEDRLLLLQGLLDTDGTVVDSGGHHVSFCSTSEQLAHDVTFLVRSLGGTTTTQQRITSYTDKHNEKKKGRPSYHLTVSLPNRHRPFLLKRKAGRVTPKTKYPPRRYISGVEFVGNKEAQCLVVAHPSHLYVMDNFVVTHNTRSILVIAAEFAKRLGKPALIIVPNKTIIETRYGPDLQTLGLAGRRDIIIDTYGKMREEKVGKDDYSITIFDEAHKLKNSHSEQSYRASVIKGSFRLYATATPMDNWHNAAYFMAEITGRPQQEIERALGYEIRWREDPWTKEMRPYPVLLEGYTPAKVYANITKFRDEAIRAGAMVRREFPFYGTIGMLRVNLSPDRTMEQQRVEAWWNYKIDNARSGTARMHWAGQKIGELSRWSEPLKTKLVFDRIVKDLSLGKRIVVFGEHHGETTIKALEDEKKSGILTQLSDMLNGAGIKHAKIYGTRDKAAEVKQFQRGDFKVALATPASGGAGIDLDDQVGDAPRVVYITAANWSGDITDQALGRVSRRNTMSPAEIWMIFGESITSDRSRMSTVLRKLETLTKIQAGEDPDIVTLRKWLSENQEIAMTEEGDQYLLRSRGVAPLIKDAYVKREGPMADWTDELRKDYQTALELTPSIEKTLRFVKAGEENYLVFANGVRAIIGKHGVSEIVGAQVRSSRELAEVLQILRNPAFETSYIILTDDAGKIKDVVPLSVGVPGQTFAVPAGLHGQADLRNWLTQRMARTGATNVWNAHNHPSGRTKPSEDDLKVVGSYEEAMGARYKGHVIINHGEYTAINSSKGKVTYETIKATFKENPLGEVKMGHSLLGEQVSSSGDIAMLLRRLGPLGAHPLLVGMGWNADVRGMAIFKPAEMTIGYLKGQIGQFAQDVGSPLAYLANIDWKQPGLEGVLEHLIQEGFLADALTEDGRSMVASIGRERPGAARFYAKLQAEKGGTFGRTAADVVSKLSAPISPPKPEDMQDSVGMKIAKAWRGTPHEYLDGPLGGIAEHVIRGARGIRRIIRVLGVPQYVGNRVPELQEAVYASAEAFYYGNELYKDVEDELTYVRDKLKPSEQEMLRVANALWRGNDPDVRQYFYKEELRTRFGLTDRETDIYERVVRAQRLATDTYVQSMRFYLMRLPVADSIIMNLEWDGPIMEKILDRLSPAETETLRTGMDYMRDRLEMPPAFKREWDRVKNIIHDIIVDDSIRREVDKLGGYISQRRHGNYWVEWHDSAGTRFWNQYDLQSEASQAMKRMRLEGYEKIRTGTMRELNLADLHPDSFAEVMDLIEQFGMQDDPEMQRIVNEFMGRGARAHMIHRENVPGFERTFGSAMRSIADYARSASRKLARTKGYFEAKAALSNVSYSNHPDEYKLINDYIEGYFSRPESEFAFLRKAVYTTTLALSPTFMIQQILQPYATHLPNLILEAGPVTGNWIFAQGQVISALYMAGRLIPGLRGLATGEELGAFIDKAMVRKSIQGSMIDELAGGPMHTGKILAPGLTDFLNSMKTSGKEKTQEVLLIMEKMLEFSGAVTERKNRIEGLIQGYLLGKHRGLTGDKLFKFAERWTSYVNILYGRYNLPIFLLKETKGFAQGVARMFYIFQSFPNSVWHMIGNTVRGKYRWDRKLFAAIEGTAAWTLLAGIGGIAGYFFLDILFKTIYDQPLLGFIRKKTKDAQWPEWVRMTLSAGLLSLFGIDMRKSLGMGDSSILDPSRWWPVTFGARAVKAVQAFERGETVEGIRQLPVPALVKGALRAREADQYGITYGARTIVPANKVTERDKTLLRLNITPFGAGEQMDIESEKHDIMASHQAKFDQFADAFSKAYVREDAEAKNRVIDQVKEYNKHLEEMGLRSLQIQMQSLQRGVGARIMESKLGPAGRPTRERSVRETIRKGMGIE